MSQRVYAQMFSDARLCVENGWPVVMDAVFAKAAERDAAEEIARNAGVPFRGIWLTAPFDVLRNRIDRRTHDASDATAAIAEKQLEWIEDPKLWLNIDAAGPPDHVVAGVLNRLA